MMQHPGFLSWGGGSGGGGAAAVGGVGDGGRLLHRTLSVVGFVQQPKEYANRIGR